jgi:DNA repair protein RecO (recombination protein O)
MTAELRPAFVLHRRAFGESSLIVEFLTRDQGRIAALAKGSRSASRSSLRVEPFQRLDIVLRGRGELPLLVRAESPVTAVAPRLSGLASLAGLYLNELLLALLQRDDPHPVLFEHYGSCLETLATQPGPALRRFEWALLRELGYAPDLAVDHGAGLIDPCSRYDYDPHAGLQLSPRGRWSGDMLLALQQGSPAHAGAQRAFLREQLSLQLDGQRLRSWDLLADIDRALPLG